MSIFKQLDKIDIEYKTIETDEWNMRLEIYNIQQASKRRILSEQRQFKKKGKIAIA